MDRSRLCCHALHYYLRNRLDLLRGQEIQAIDFEADLLEDEEIPVNIVQPLHPSTPQQTTVIEIVDDEEEIEEELEIDDLELDEDTEIEIIEDVYEEEPEEEEIFMIVEDMPAFGPCKNSAVMNAISAHNLRLSSTYQRIQSTRPSQKMPVFKEPFTFTLSSIKMAMSLTLKCCAPLMNALTARLCA